MLPIANSMLQVQAWTGMPIELIKSLKSEGCEAFESGGRVRLGILLRFFFESYWDEVEKPPDGLATWREALNRVQTHRQEILLDRDKGKVLDAQEAEARAAEAEAYYFSELDRALRELPTGLCGMTANQIADKLGQFFADLKTRSREKFKAVAQPVAQP